MESSLTRVLLFCLCLQITLGGSCPSGWSNFGKKCFLFPYSQNQRLSFYQAEDFCREKGGHLASIHSNEENDFLQRTAGSSSRRWIGMNVLKGNSTPEWTDGSVVDYRKIVPKEYGSREKCFAFMPEKNGWRPEHCELHYLPICQISTYITPTTTIPPPVVDGHCPKDWFQFKQKCYKFFGKKEEERVQYKQARNACWKLGKDHELVSIHSAEEQAYLTQQLYNFGSSAWIGIQKIESDEIGHDIVFGWVDNSRKDYTNWAFGNPPTGTWKYCGRLDVEGVAKGEWIADYCEIDKYGYLCQRPVDPAIPKPDPEPTQCDSNSIEYRDSCYRYFSDAKTQQKAEESCVAIGGHLVSILDGYEQAFLFNYIQPTSKLIWNGLSSVQNTRYLRWSDKEPLHYSNWILGEPRWNLSKQVCSALDSQAELRWTLVNCTLELPYVCEMYHDENPPIFPEVMGVCSSIDSIDIGDDYCYEVTIFSESWDSSLRSCLSKGMQMVKIYSDHQTNSLLSYLWKENNTINLGMFRKNDKSGFVWVDGSGEPTYSNWDKREPSDYPGDLGCVGISQRTGKWRTKSCSSSGITLCQSPKQKKLLI